MVYIKALQAANSVRNFVGSIGESPQEEDGTVEGEETDEFIRKVEPSVMDLLGIGGRKFQN